MLRRVAAAGRRCEFLRGWRAPGLHRMPRQVLQQQRVDALRHLVRGVVADAGQRHEAVGRGDEVAGASAAVRPTVSSTSPHMNSVGTLTGPIGRCTVPRARYQASAASIAGALPMTARCFSVAAGGMPLRRAAYAAVGVVGQQPGPAPGSRNALWWRERCGCSGSSRERAAEGVGVRARQHRERAEPLRPRPAISQARLPPQSCPTRWKRPRARPSAADEVERVADQDLDVVLRQVGRVRPRTGGIAALVRRRGEDSRPPPAPAAARRRGGARR